MTTSIISKDAIPVTGTSNATTQLRVDSLYRNTNNWNNAKDEFNRFFRFPDGKGINNTSGFRPKSKANTGRTDILDCAFCVLVTNFEESEWPDSLNVETGLFTYYGDNRSPGSAIDKTPVGGNRLLQDVFSKAHSQRRQDIPPFLCFEKVKRVDGTYMRYLGLACPGAQGLSALDDLGGIWRIKGDQRFQNYRAVFTILREEITSKAWLDDLAAGVAPADSVHCPRNWKYWVDTGIYKALECERETLPRTKSSQQPWTSDEGRVLREVHSGLSEREFEFAAAEIVRLMDGRFRNLTVTQAVRDGGRDVVGTYVVGHPNHEIRLSAYIEAKRWNLTSAVGVKPMMRLISRLKHRDLGVFVTTSFFAPQVQEELIEDRHPILLVSGGDIARVLIENQLGDPIALSHWIKSVKSHAAT